MELNKVEKEVLMTLINACLSGMGGEKPSDLWKIFTTWVEPKIWSIKLLPILLSIKQRVIFGLHEKRFD